MEVGDHPSMACLNFYGHLGGQMDERSIFRPNRCAIAHDFGVRHGVRACRGTKINGGVRGRLSIVLVWSVQIFVAMWVDRRAKQRERGIFGPNWCALAHEFRGGPGVRGCRVSKIDLGVPGRLGSILIFLVYMGGAI